MSLEPENLKTEAFAGLNFIEELDKLKRILRQSVIYDQSRRENTAEHSWHLSTAVLALSRHSNRPINLERALKIALVHDVVEIDADDTFVYDTVKQATKYEREQKAAERIFGLLPQDIGAELKELWEAYEVQECPESQFVASLDRLLPMIANFNSDGHSWKKHGIRSHQVIERNSVIEKGSTTLWAYAKSLIQESIKRGYLAD